MAESFIALITPLNKPVEGAHPEHPIVLPPVGTPPIDPDAHPEHPIFLPPDDAKPEHPIYIPVEPPEGVHPEHPIYIPVYPSHPIVIPPLEGNPGTPEHPINKPPNDSPGWVFIFVPGQGWMWVQFSGGAELLPPTHPTPKR